MERKVKLVGKRAGEVIRRLGDITLQVQQARTQLQAAEWVYLNYLMTLAELNDLPGQGIVGHRVEEDGVVIIYADGKENGRDG